MRRARWVLLGVILFLVAVRASLPFLVKDYVNHQLNSGNDYGGRLAEIRIQLWRGQYTIKSLEIFEEIRRYSCSPLFGAPNGPLYRME